jgi:hypothetical protein
MPSKVPSLSDENQAKLDAMLMCKCEISFEEYEGSGWSILLGLPDVGILNACYFDAPTADECVKDAFQYFLGRYDAESQMVALRS